MGTKTEPGKYDCYSKLAPDEPYFVLMGRDALSADLVDTWATQASVAGCDFDKVREARELAQRMREYFPRKNPD